MNEAFTPEMTSALNFIQKEKAGILPPYLSRAELDACLEAWHRLWNDPTIENANKRFIVDHKIYLEPAFARVATHPVVQEVVRRTIGEFQLAGYAVVATPRNGEREMRPDEVPFHVDHCVYSDVKEEIARDTFVCVWANFEDIAMENGPFCIAVGTDKWSIGWDFFKDGKRPNLKVVDMKWPPSFNIGPAGTTAVYSGKTWHSATTNASEVVRKGLNMNFVPKHPLDSLRRSSFDLCALSESNYAKLTELIDIPGYLIDRVPEFSGMAMNVKQY